MPGTYAENGATYVRLGAELKRRLENSVPPRQLSTFIRDAVEAALDRGQLAINFPPSKGQNHEG